MKNILVVISGPAGSGKGTVIKKVFEKSDEFHLSVSATTRKPRPGEKNGVNYFFMSREEFETLVKEEKMLEYTEYVGNYYGTPKEKVLQTLKEKNVMLEIETDGAMQIKKRFPDAVLILLVPPSFSKLRERLYGRGTEPPEVIERRLSHAEYEISFLDKYDYVIVNEDGGIDQAAEDVITIVKAEKKRADRNMEVKEKFYE